jgi:hypothetical protein
MSTLGLLLTTGILSLAGGLVGGYFLRVAHVGVRLRHEIEDVVDGAKLQIMESANRVEQTAFETVERLEDAADVVQGKDPDADD